MKLSAGMKYHLSEMMVTVPFVVMEWDERETEWYPVYCSSTVMSAVEQVKLLLKEDPSFNWDIQADFKTALKVIVDLEK